MAMEVKKNDDIVVTLIAFSRKHHPWSLRISDKNVRHVNSMSLFTILLFPNLMFMSMAGLFV